MYVLKHCCYIYPLRVGILAFGYVTLVWYIMNVVEQIVEAGSQERLTGTLWDILSGYYVAKTFFMLSFYAALHKIWYVCSLIRLFKAMPEEDFVNHVIFQTYLVVNGIVNVLILIATHLSNVFVYKVCYWYYKIYLVLFTIWAGILTLSFFIREHPPDVEPFYPLLYIAFSLHLTVHAYFTLVVKSQIYKLEKYKTLTQMSLEQSPSLSNNSRRFDTEDVPSDDWIAVGPRATSILPPLLARAYERIVGKPFYLFTLQLGKNDLIVNL